MFKTVLLPIDLGSEASWIKALPAAIDLTAQGGTLHVVSVVPDNGFSLVAGYFPEDFAQKALHAASEKLEAWVAGHLVGTGVNYREHLVHGRIYDEIMQAADKVGADLIVMASHRPEAADHLLGTNAGRVVSHARQSVFVVRN